MIRNGDGHVVHIGQAESISQRLDTHRSGNVFTSALAQGVYQGLPFADQETMAATARALMSDFSVQWLLTENLDVLEQALKERYQPRFDHNAELAVDASSLTADAPDSTCSTCLRPLDDGTCFVCAEPDPDSERRTGSSIFDAVPGSSSALRTHQSSPKRHFS